MSSLICNWWKAFWCFKTSLTLRFVFCSAKFEEIYIYWSILSAFCWTVLDNFCLMSIEKACNYSVSLPLKAGLASAVKTERVCTYHSWHFLRGITALLAHLSSMVNCVSTHWLLAFLFSLKALLAITWHDVKSVEYFGRYIVLRNCNFKMSLQGFYLCQFAFILSLYWQYLYFSMYVCINVSTLTFFHIVMIRCFEQSIHKLYWKGLIKRVILFIIVTNL